MPVKHQVDVGDLALAVGGADAGRGVSQMFGAGEMHVTINEHPVLRRDKQVPLNPQNAAFDQDWAQICILREGLAAKGGGSDPADRLRAVVHGGDQIADAQIVDQNITTGGADGRTRGKT